MYTYPLTQSFLSLGLGESPNGECIRKEKEDSKVNISGINSFNYTQYNLKASPKKISHSDNYNDEAHAAKRHQKLAATLQIPLLDHDQDMLLLVFQIPGIDEKRITRKVCNSMKIQVFL